MGHLCSRLSSWLRKARIYHGGCASPSLPYRLMSPALHGVAHIPEISGFTFIQWEEVVLRNPGLFHVNAFSRQNSEIGILMSLSLLWWAGSIISPAYFLLLFSQVFLIQSPLPSVPFHLSSLCLLKSLEQTNKQWVAHAIYL